jgi:hypothetical protein
MPMPAEPVSAAERAPRRARYVIPRDTPRRGELLAAIGIALIILHVIFAQLTLVLALVFIGMQRVSRWRPAWLAVPAAAGLVWTLAIGPAAAAAGFTAGPARVASYLGGIFGHSGRLLHLGVAYADMGHWLPRQLPIALIAGAAEAALAAWLDWLHTDEWDVRPPRPGLIVAIRRAVITRSVRSGGVVTRNGACLGVDDLSGARAALSWAELAGSVLITGAPRSGTTTSSFQLVHAAVRLRKPVIVVNLGGGTDLAAPLSAVCAVAGAPFYEFSAAGPASYEPFRFGSPARRASLVTAMLNWSGTIDHYRRSFAAYLTGVFELIDAAPADPRIPVLDDVAHLLDPLALEARLEQVPAHHARRPQIAERARVSVSQARADPALLMTAASQLAQLRTSPLGRWLRPAGSAARGHIDIGRIVRERAVVLFSLGSAGHASAAARLAWLAGQDILAADEDLRDIGIDGDGLAWFDHCEGLPQPMLRDLISRGAEAGLPVVLTTTSARAGAGVAPHVNALGIHRMPDADSAELFAGHTGERLVPDLGAGPLAAGPAAGRGPGEPGSPEETGPGGPADAAILPAAANPVAAALPASGPGKHSATAIRARAASAVPSSFARQSRVPAARLQQLGRGEFVLVVRQPARLVTTARTVPASVPEPRAAGAAGAPPAVTLARLPAEETA